MKAKMVLPVVLMVVFALTRWPGLMPWNFSAAYAMMFCAGVFFPKRLAWWLPFATMLASDLCLNLYYRAQNGTPWVSPEMLGNYLAYAALVWLGRRFTPKAGFLSLVCGGVLGAALFYLVTNTFSWFFNIFQAPEYTKTLAGWLIALTKGTANYSYPVKMQTWELFRNTLISGGLFTGLFAGAMKLMNALTPAEEEEPAPEKSADDQPEEAKAA